MIGVDTLSLDPGNATDVHRVTSTGWGRTATASRGSPTSATIPPRGATLIVGVIPWEEGSGGPCRLLATLLIGAG